MSDTRAAYQKWAKLGEKKRKPLTLRQQIACLEIDMALMKEAYEARLAGHPSVGELPIFAVDGPLDQELAAVWDANTDKLYSE